MKNEKLNRLIFNDLCARLPYGVKIRIGDDDAIATITTTLQVIGKNIDSEDAVNGLDFDRFEIKPYLRPVTSMTEKEKKELRKLLCSTYAPEDCPIIDSDFSITIDYSCNEREVCDFYDMGDIRTYIDFCLKNHFDINGLIKKGGAIEVNENNNPYKN